jgi:hypothetical protein
MLLVVILAACGDQPALDRAEARKIGTEAQANLMSTSVALNGSAQATQIAVQIAEAEAELNIVKEEAQEFRRHADWEATRAETYDRNLLIGYAAAAAFLMFAVSLGAIFVWRVWKTTGMLQGQAQLWKEQRAGTLQLDQQTLSRIIMLLTGMSDKPEPYVLIDDQQKLTDKRLTRR